jgi:hypothetical protein
MDARKWQENPLVPEVGGDKRRVIFGCFGGHCGEVNPGVVKSLSD